MNSFTQDLRYGLRSLLKTPGFTLVAVLTLALGVGANTAIFSVLEAVVLRDLPYHDPDRLAVLWTRNIRQNLPDGSSFLNFRDWKAQSREFENMAAYVRPEFTRGTLGGSEAERIYLALVGDGFFQILGTSPLVGRWFETADFVEQPRVVGHQPQPVAAPIRLRPHGARPDDSARRSVGGGRRRDATGVPAAEPGHRTVAAAVLWRVRPR